MSLSADTKTPQTHLEICFAEGGASASLAPKSILLIGASITTDLSAAMVTDGSDTTETRTTTAGVAPLNVATMTSGAAHAKTLAGRGSELAIAAAAVFQQYPQARLYLAPLTPNGSSRATGTITPTISTLSAGTLRITVCGESVDIPVSASDDVHTIGLAIARAVNNQTDWPVTATNTWNTGAVVLRSKIIGPRGHGISFRATLSDATSSTTVSSGAGVTLFGLTITLSGGTADGSLYRLSGGGTADDSVTTLLANIAADAYDRVCLAGYLVSGATTAKLAALVTQVGAQLNDARQFNQQIVVGAGLSVASSVSVAAVSSPLVQVVGLQGADDLPLAIAGQAAAMRLFGDAIAAGAIEGEATNPAANLNGGRLATIKAPAFAADRYEATEVEALLNAGVTPLVSDGGRPGRVMVVSSITSRSTLDGVVPDFSVFKTYDVTVPQWVRAEVLADLRTTYRGKKIVPDSASGAPDPRTGVVQPRQIKSRVFGLLKRFEARGIIMSVEEADVSATINGSNPRRVDIAFPCIPTQDLDITHGTLRQQQPATV